MCSSLRHNGKLYSKPSAHNRIFQTPVTITDVLWPKRPRTSKEHLCLPMFLFSFRIDSYMTSQPRNCFVSEATSFKSSRTAEETISTSLLVSYFNSPVPRPYILTNIQHDYVIPERFTIQVPIQILLKLHRELHQVRTLGSSPLNITQLSFSG
jgi:hypothetical protein